MSALSKIQSAGFVLSLIDGNLNVTPTKMALTDTQRNFIKLHKAKIINQLQIETIAIEQERLKFVCCGDCLNFKSNNKHGWGSGSCLSSGSYGSWGDTKHQCDKFNAINERIHIPKPSPHALIVTCYTPNGEEIMIEAKDEVHALYLAKMNPKRQNYAE